MGVVKIYNKIKIERLEYKGNSKWYLLIDLPWHIDSDLTADESSFGPNIRKVLTSMRAHGSLPLGAGKYCSIHLDGLKIVSLDLTASSYTETVKYFNLQATPKSLAEVNGSVSDNGMSISSLDVTEDIPSENSFYDKVQGKIVTVIDGDTIVLKITDGPEEYYGPNSISTSSGYQTIYGQMEIRLAGCNTPESEDAGTQLERNLKWAAAHNMTVDSVTKFASKVSKYARAEMLNKNAIIIIDKANQMDSYGRYIGIVYLKLTDTKAINFNKTLIQKGYADVSLPYGSSSAEATTGSFNIYSWVQYLNKDHCEGNFTSGEYKLIFGKDDPKDKAKQEAKPWQHVENLGVKEKDGTIIFDVPPENETWGYIDNTLKIPPCAHKDRNDPLTDYYFRIGDCEFIIPPLSIHVSKNMHNTRVNTLRNKASIQTKTGHSDVVIEVELYFHDLDSINGIEVRNPMDTGNYYIDGLRSLIAQFKKAPFLPIENKYLNENFDIYAASLVNLNVHTVPNYPKSLAATLTMFKFDHTPFLYQETLDEAINYPIFRWYYQQSLQDHGPYKTYLAPATLISSKIDWEIADEEKLQIIESSVKQLRTMTEPSAYEDKTNNNTAVQYIKTESELIKKGLVQQKRYNEWKKNGVLSNWGDEEFHKVIYKDETAVFIPTEMPNAIDKPCFLLNLNSVDNKQLCSAFFRANTVNQYTIPASRTDIISKISKGHDYVQQALDLYNNDYNGISLNAHMTEGQLETVPWAVNGLIIESITVSHENIITPLQLQDTDCPTHQFLGSQDTYIQIQAQTTSEATLQSLKTLFSTAERYSREYRWGITSGFLKADNDLLRLFGVQYVLVESMTVDTVVNYPGLYSVNIVLVGFDKTQSDAEALKQMSLGNLYDTAQDLRYEYDTLDQFGFESVLIEMKMKELEIYPDLELPTFDELNKVFHSLVPGMKSYANPRKAKYVDPDFYISTNETFRSQANKMKMDGEVRELVFKDKADSWMVEKTPTKKTGDNPNTVIDPKVLEELDAVQKRKEAYGPIPEPSPASVYDGMADSLNSPYAQATGKNFGMENMSKNYVSDSYDWDKVKNTRPTINEWNSWNEYPAGTSNATIQKDIDNIQNPSYAQIAGKIYEYVEELFNFTSPAERTEIVRWMKAMCEQESGWGQYVQANGLWWPKKNGSTSAVGLMQLIMSIHSKNNGAGGCDLIVARRLAWDWQYNLWRGIKYYRVKYKQSRASKRSDVRDNYWYWSIRSYHDGNFNGKNQAGVAYVRQMTARYRRYADNKYADPKSTYNSSIVACFSGDTKSKAKVVTKTVANDAGIQMKVEATAAAVNDTSYNDAGIVMKQKAVATDTAELNDYNDAGIQMALNENYDAEIPKETVLDIEKDEIYDTFHGMYQDIMHYDMRGRLARAFPTFQMFLVDEGKWMLWRKMWDNFYGFNAIQSIDVMKSRKMAADTCIITMSNIYSNLTQRDSTVKYGGHDYKYWDTFIWGLPTDSDSLIDARKTYLHSLSMQTGARLHLRLGYSSNSLDLPIVFNGTITELNTEEIITIIAQGDGIELCNKIAAKPDEANDKWYWKIDEPRKTICDLLSDRENNFFAWIAEPNQTSTPDYAVNSPRGEVTGDLQASIEKDISTQDKDAGFIRKLAYTLGSTNANGIAHFGRSNITISPLNDEYGEIGVNIYTANGKGTFSQWVQTKADEDVRSGIETAGDFIKTDDGLLGLEITSWGIPWSAGDEPSIEIFLYDKSIWDVAQTFAYAVPDYIATVCPFEFNSTLFFGKPYWGVMDRYNWKYVYDEKLGGWKPQIDGATTKDGDIYKVNVNNGGPRKPLMQYRMYLSDTDIVANQIKTSEDGVYTNVIVNYNTGYGETPHTSSLISADADIISSKQKTTIVQGDISDDGSGEKYANSFGASVLRDFLKEMYQGQLVVIGDPSVKPYDLMYIKDTYQELEGNCIVREVNHHFSHETGFITAITPDALVVTDDRKMMTLANWGTRLAVEICGTFLIYFAGIKAWKKFPGTPLAMFVKKHAGSAKQIVYDLLEGVLKDTTINPNLRATNNFLFKALREASPKDWGKIISHPNVAALLKENKNMKGIVGIVEKVAASYAKGGKFAKTVNLAGLIVRGGIGVAAAAGPQILAAVACAWITSTITEWLSREFRNRQACLMSPLMYKGYEFTAGVNFHQGLVVGDAPGMVDKFIEDKLGWLEFLGVEVPDYTPTNKED